MPRIQCNDINMFYQLIGKGRPLVFISGLGLDHATWLPVLEEFMNEYQVLIFDNRGVGQSDTSQSPYSISMMAEDTLCLMRSLGFENADIIGHSMGGAIAQELAIKHPDIIDNLVIYASAAKMPARSTIPFNSQFYLWQENIDVNLLIRNILPWLYSEELLSSPRKVEAVIQDIKNYPYPQTIEGFRNQSLACQSFNFRDAIHQIKAKTLVLVGEDDIATPVNESQYIASQILNATLKIVPKMAHVFHQEQPQLFSKIIKDFLQEPLTPPLRHTL